MFLYCILDSAILTRTTLWLPTPIPERMAEGNMMDKTTVDDILRLGDSALVQMLQKARNSSGSFDGLKIYGWEKVPEAKRELLGERLR